MSYEFGDVVLVPFPFTNQAASKKRPAVIVSSGGYNRAKPDVVVGNRTMLIRSNCPGLFSKLNSVASVKAL